MSQIEVSTTEINQEHVQASIPQNITQERQEIPQEALQFQGQKQPQEEKKVEQIQQKDQKVNKTQNQEKKPNSSQRRARKGRSRSPEGKQETQERKRQSSQPAVQVSKDIIDQLIQEGQDKKNKESYQVGSKAAQRLYKYSEDQKNKKKTKVDAIVQEQMKECTFKPQTLGRPNYQQRNFDEFLNSQMKYERLKKEKIQTKKEEILEKQLQQEQEMLQSKNYLCQGSAKILSKQAETKPFHERLYQAKQKAAVNKQLSGNQNEESSNIQNVSQQEEQNQLFMPKINPKSKNLKRDCKIEDLLYAESKKREEKQKLLKQDEQKTEVKTSQSSKKVLRKRLVAEYKEQLSQIEGLSRISYANLSRILQQLHFIKNEMSEPNYQKERELQRLLWNVLQGDELNGINDKNLLKFILAFNNLYEQKKNNPLESTQLEQESILGQIETQQQALDEKTLQAHDQINQEKQQIQGQEKRKSDQSSEKQPSEISEKQPSEHSKKQSSENQEQNKEDQGQLSVQKETAKEDFNDQSVLIQHKYGSYQEQEDVFVINEQQAFKIFCDFKLFYNNRHSLMKNNVNPTYKQTIEVKQEFKPQLDKNSQRMAQQLREKKGEANIVEHLINQGKEKEQKLKDIKEKIEQEKSQTYTFRPNTAKPSKTKFIESQEKESETQGPRFERLFNMHKDIKQKAEERQKQKKEQEEVIGEDCTFKPKLETNNYNLQKSTSKKALEIKGVEAMVNRMQAGRFDKERVESVLERGKDVIKEQNTPQANFAYLNKKSQQIIEEKKKKTEKNLEEEDQANLTEKDLKFLQKKKELLEKKEQQRKIEELKKQEQHKKMEEVRKQKEEQKKIMMEKRKEEEKAKRAQKQQMIEEAKKIKQEKLEEMKKAQKEKTETDTQQKAQKPSQQENKKNQGEETKQDNLKKREISTKQNLKAKSTEKPNTPKRNTQKKQQNTTSSLKQEFQQTQQEENSTNFSQEQSQLQNQIVSQEINQASQQEITLSQYGINEVTITESEKQEFTSQTVVQTYEIKTETQKSVTQTISEQVTEIKNQQQ